MCGGLWANVEESERESHWVYNSILIGLCARCVCKWNIPCLTAVSIEDISISECRSGMMSLHSDSLSFLLFFVSLFFLWGASNTKWLQFTIYVGISNAFGTHQIPVCVSIEQIAKVQPTLRHRQQLQNGKIIFPYNVVALELGHCDRYDRFGYSASSHTHTRRLTTELSIFFSTFQFLNPNIFLPDNAICFVIAAHHPTQKTVIRQ